MGVEMGPPQQRKAIDTGEKGADSAERRARPPAKRAAHTQQGPRRPERLLRSSARPRHDGAQTCAVVPEQRSEPGRVQLRGKGFQRNHHTASLIYKLQVTRVTDEERTFGFWKSNCMILKGGLSPFAKEIVRQDPRIPARNQAGRFPF